MSDAEALETAVAAIARAERTTAEVDRLLERKGFGAEQRARVIALAIARGFVDDDRAAAVRAESLARRGRGDAAIRADLHDRGVSAAIIDVALGALEPESARAIAIASRRGATPATARLLASRGFAQDAIETAVAVADDHWLP